MSIGEGEFASCKAGARSFLLVFAASLAVLLAAEAPALWTVFAHHDQYRFFIETLGDPAVARRCEANRQYLWAYKIGRPLTAELECMIFRGVKVPADLTAYRFAVVALQALASAVMALTLRRCRLSWPAAGALGIAVFLLPGELNAVVMANFANVLAPVLALASHALLEAAGGSGTWPRGWRGFVLAAAAWICLMAACHLFLGLVVFFFVASFAQALLGSGERKWNQAIRDILFCASVLLPYYLLLIFFYMPNFAPGQPVPPSYATALTLGSVLGGLLKLLILLSAMANFWNIYPFAGAFAVVAIVIMAARVTADVRHSPAIEWIGGRGAGRLLLLLILLGAASIVFIVSPVWLVYRLVVAPSAILLLWLFASLVALLEAWQPGSCARAERALAFTIAAVAAIFAGQTMSESVVASALERAYIRTVIANAPAGSFDQVAVVEPPTNSRSPYGLSGRPYASDEFNMPSTLGSNNLGSNVPEMVRAAMLELGRHDGLIVDAENPMRVGGLAGTTVLPDGRVQVNAANGWSSQGEVRDGLVLLPVGVIGVLSADRRTITWNTGVIWRDGPGGLNGTWNAVLNPAAIPVSRLRAGALPQAPRTLVIDMAKAAFSTGRL
ncbi:MAG: hypothetical protein ACHQRJ_18100 [Alphaproteobacteria bacterium]